MRARFDEAPDRSLVIHPGSDLDVFPPDEGSPGRGDDRECIGMVYRLERDKLDETSIDPFLEIARLRPSAEILVVGGGGLLQSFRTAVRRAGLDGRVTFTGYVAYDRLRSLYRKMSVFVAPVHRESFGQVSVFAMGCELPVAGYMVGALEEILGSTELLVPTGDSEGLARVVVELLSDPTKRADIGRANRARAQQLFSVETMIARYASLYSEALAGPLFRRSGRRPRFLRS